MKQEAKETIHNIVFWILIIIILVYVIVGVDIYMRFGTKSCLEEQISPYSNDTQIVCFNTSKERSQYIIDKISESHFDNNYINDSYPINISK